MKHQTDYRKQILILINRKNYEYVNKAPRLHKIAPKRAKNILSHLKFSLVGGVLAVSLLIIWKWLPVTHT